MLGITTQQAAGQSMEGANPQPVGGRADVRGDALAELPGGLIGEGNGDDGMCR